MKTVLLTD